MKPNRSPREEVVRLVMAHRSMIATQVNCMIRDPILAEDTFQDAMVAILESWDRYDPSRSFAAWARAIAHNVGLATLREQARQPCVLPSETIESVVEKSVTFGSEPELELLQEALVGCVQQLSPRHQTLVRFRYYENRSYAEISSLVGKPVKTLYVTYQRLKTLLWNCVQREREQE
jgi:RNA polymerase sigma factor (sigma-70 family)